MKLTDAARRAKATTIGKPESPTQYAVSGAQIHAMTPTIIAG